MLNLAIDTSSAHGTVALGNQAALVQQIELEDSRRASATLFHALSKIGLPKLQLSSVIVGLGPGSFSGIRVGLAAAQAIALTQKISVRGICSAYSVACRHKHVSRLGVFCDARREEIFCTVFSEGRLQRPTYLIPRSALEEEISKMTLAVTSDGLKGIPNRDWPVAADLLTLPDDLDQWQETDLEPIHLREMHYKKVSPKRDRNTSTPIDDETRALPVIDGPKNSKPDSL